MAQWESALAWALTDSEGGTSGELEMFQPRKRENKGIQEGSPAKRKRTDIILYIKSLK